MSDFLGNLRSQELFPPPNFDEKLADLRRRKDKFEEYVTRTRERFATEESNLLRDRSEAERLRAYMGELVRVAGVAEATPSEGEVGETENPRESKGDKPKNSAHESEGGLSPETSSGEGEVGETKNSGESEDDKPKNSAHESEGELSPETSSGEGEVGETENPRESKGDKPKNSARESEDELSAETSDKTLDKSDAESVYDMQTVRLALHSPEESVTLSLQSLNEESGT